MSVSGDRGGLILHIDLRPTGSSFVVDTAVQNTRDQAAYLDADQCGRVTEVVLARTVFEPEGETHTGSAGQVKELLDLLEGLWSDPGVSSTARYVCPLAGYYSHAGNHPAAVKILRDYAAVALGPDESAAIGYHLAYALARSADAACVPEIDRLLGALPPDYPSVPALAHTTALRHLTAGDHMAALVAAYRSLESDALAPAEAAEVHLTAATALTSLGRHAEAAENRAEASRHAPHHQLLDLVHT